MFRTRSREFSERRIQRKIEAFADEIARETDEELLWKEEPAVMELLQEYLEMKRK